MKTALIVSLNFRVAHISHLIASYKQFSELGYRSILYIHPDLISYLPKDIIFTTTLNNIKHIDIAIFWFPALGNVSLMLKLKLKFKTKIIYVFHEPLEKYNDYRISGFSHIKIISIYLKYFISLVIIKMADIIILPSKKAISLYQGSIAECTNKQYRYVPLIFDDESSEYKCQERLYFSYIGTITSDHAFEEYLSFIIKAAEDTSIPPTIKFLIASRNKVPKSGIISKLLEKGILTIVDGHPLTNEEINKAYRESFLIWNAYHRTTQSGVLAKASMFGTPVIIQNKNKSEFTIEGKNIVSVTNNNNYNDIKDCVLTVWDNIISYSKNSKEIFNTSFYYKAHNETIKNIISNI